MGFTKGAAERIAAKVLANRERRAAERDRSLVTIRILQTGRTVRTSAKAAASQVRQGLAEVVDGVIPAAILEGGKPDGWEGWVDNWPAATESSPPYRSSRVGGLYTDPVTGELAVASTPEPPEDAVLVIGDGDDGEKPPAAPAAAAPLTAAPDPIDRSEPDWPERKEQPITRFTRDVLKFRLTPLQARLLNIIYADGIRQAVLRLGRRSGKGRIAAIVAVYEATVGAAKHLANVPAGEQIGIVVVAVSQKQAGIVHGYIRNFLAASPDLERLVVRETQDRIELSNGIVIHTLPCFAASIRGLTLAVVILDEAAHFAGIDGSSLDPAELWSSLTPAVWSMPDHRILVLSTPKFAGGWFARLCARAASGRVASMREFVCGAPAMRPDFPDRVFEAEREEDPYKYRREAMAQFEAGEGAALDPEAIERAVVLPRELPPERGVSYLIAVDPSQGLRDRFTWLVTHRDSDGVIWVDKVKAHRNPKGGVAFDSVLAELAADAKTYNGAEIVSDNYLAVPLRQSLAAKGAHARILNWTQERKFEAMSRLRVVLERDRLRLPRHAGLIEELNSLSMKTTAAGGVRIAAPGSRHDDFATACMAAVYELDRGATMRVTFSDWNPWG